MTTPAIKIECEIPKGWIPVAYKCPVPGEYYLVMNTGNREVWISKYEGTFQANWPALVCVKERWSPKVGDTIWRIYADEKPGMRIVREASLASELELFNKDLLFRTKEEAECAYAALKTALKDMKTRFGYAVK